MITSVSIKGFKTGEGKTELTERNILVGPNGSGKSTILEAIQLGLTGYTKQGKKPSSTLQFSSGDDLEVTISDGTNFLARKFEKKGPGGAMTVILNGEVIKDASGIPETLRFPVEAVHPEEFLALSGDKRAEWLFQAMGGGVDQITPDQITPASFPWFEKPMSATALLEKLADELSSNKKEIARCKANLQLMMGGELLPVGAQKEWEERLKSIDAGLSIAEKELSAEQEREKLGESRHTLRLSLEEQLRKADAKIQETEEEIDRLSGILKKEVRVPPRTPAAYAEDISKLENRVAVLKEQATTLRKQAEMISTLGSCPTCGTKAENLDGVLSEWDRLATCKEGEIEEAEENLFFLRADKEAAVTATEEAKTVQDASLDVKVLKDSLKSYKKSREGIENELIRVNNVGGNAAIDQTALLARVEGLKTQQNECRANLKAHYEATSIKKQRAKANDDLSKLSAIETTLKNATGTAKNFRDESLEGMTSKLQSPFDKAAQQAFGCKSFFRILSNKGKPEVDFGIVQNEREISFDTLSGGERIVILIALVAAVQIAKGGVPRLAMVEMAEADDTRCESVFGVCGNIGFEQVVLATCHTPASVPAGWSVITLGEK